MFVFKGFQPLFLTCTRRYDIKKSTELCIVVFLVSVKFIISQTM